MAGRDGRARHRRRPPPAEAHGQEGREEGRPGRAGRAEPPTQSSAEPRRPRSRGEEGRPGEEGHGEEGRSGQEAPRPRRPPRPRRQLRPRRRRRRPRRKAPAGPASDGVGADHRRRHRRHQGARRRRRPGGHDRRPGPPGHPGRRRRQDAGLHRRGDRGAGRRARGRRGRHRRGRLDRRDPLHACSSRPTWPGATSRCGSGSPSGCRSRSWSRTTATRPPGPSSATAPRGRPTTRWCCSPSAPASAAASSSHGKLLRGGARHGRPRWATSGSCPAGERCGCGRQGCLEQYASGNALVRYARARAAARPGDAVRLLDLAGGAVDGINGPLVTRAALRGRPGRRGRRSPSSAGGWAAAWPTWSSCSTRRSSWSAAASSRPASCCWPRPGPPSSTSWPRAGPLPVAADRAGRAGQHRRRRRRGRPGPALTMAGAGPVRRLRVLAGDLADDRRRARWPSWCASVEPDVVICCGAAAPAALADPLAPTWPTGAAWSTPGAASRRWAT